MKVKFLALVIIPFILFVGCSKDQESIVSSSNQNNNKSENTMKLPPKLTLSIDNAKIKTTLGGYNWSYFDKREEAMVSIEKETLPPTELINIENATNVNKNSIVNLEFQETPIDYQIRLWDIEDNIIDTYEEINFEEHKENLIFEVLTNYKQGKVSYYFSFNVS